MSSVSHLDPALVDVRTPADHPPISDGGPVRPARAPRRPAQPGVAPHVHRTFSESVDVLSGELTVHHAGEWTAFHATTR